MDYILKKNGFLAGVLFTVAAAGVAYIAYSYNKKKKEDEDRAFDIDPDNLCEGCTDDCAHCKVYEQDECEECENTCRYETISTVDKIKKTAEKVGEIAVDVGKGATEFATKAVDKIKKIINEGKVTEEVVYVTPVEPKEEQPAEESKPFEFIADDIADAAEDIADAADDVTANKDED